MGHNVLVTSDVGQKIATDELGRGGVLKNFLDYMDMVSGGTAAEKRKS